MSRGSARRRSRFSWLDACIWMVVVVGVGLLLYPTVSDAWNDYHESRVIAGYAHAVETMDERDYTAILQAAAEYNARLASDPDRFEPDEADTELYNSLLNVAESGVMAYVEIPKIDVRLPVYHGVSEATLQVAAGHIEGSSLPIGGSGTHIAISGHRGLTSATLFTHLDDLEPGDKFYIRVLTQTMAYEVDRVDVVLPEEFDLLRLESGEDYCTLITCTPYGVNSHRLLVRGTRIPYVEEERLAEEAAAPVMPETRTSGLLALGAVALLAAAAWATRPRRTERRRRAGNHDTRGGDDDVSAT